MSAPLSSRTRVGYGLGSIATGSFGTVPGLLLLPYLTDTIGIKAAIAGVIVFIPKFWDVILNPIAGRITDRHESPEGRRRPFLLRSGIALAIFFALLFSGPIAPPLIGALWVVFLFIAAATAYAFFQVPYVAMPAEMTQDYNERTRLMTWRVSLLAVAILISGGLSPMIVNAFGGEPTVNGHRLMGLFVAALLVIGSFSAWWGTKEAPEHPVETAEGSFKDQLRIVAASKDFRVLLGTFMIQALAISTLLAGVAYVAKDLIGDPAAATFLFVAFVGPAIVVTPLWERFARNRPKRTGYFASSVFLVVGTLLMTVISSGSSPIVYLAAAIVGVGYAGTQSFPMAMVPDVAADDAERSGENRIGVFTGIWTAGETAGFAMGPGLFALVLAFGGYQSSTVDETVTQSDAALTAMMLGFTVVPAALVIISMFVLRAYSLDDRLAGEKV